MKKTGKLLLFFLLTAMLLLTPCFAAISDVNSTPAPESASEASPEPTAEPTPEPAPEPTPALVVETPDYKRNEYSVLDEDALFEILAPLMEKHGASEKNFALAFYYSGTGESCFYNPDKFMIAGSLYKVPMCMLIAERVSSGELAEDAQIAGFSIDDIFRRAIVRSDNTISRIIRSELAINGSFWLPLVKYGGYALDALPPECLADDLFSARLVLNTFLTLYNEPERFPHVTEQLLLAQPTNYFHMHLKDQYPIAQKYGSLEGGLNAAGIIYTPNPIILVVMTDHIMTNHKLIGAVAEAVAQYTVDTLDTELTRQQEEAARLAAEAAEAERLAAEKAEAERLAAEKAEAERLAAEKAEAERLAAEEAARPAASSNEKSAAELAQDRQRMMLYAYAAVAALLCAVALMRRITRRTKHKTGL